VCLYKFQAQNKKHTADFAADVKAAEKRAEEERLQQKKEKNEQDKQVFLLFAGTHFTCFTSTKIQILTLFCFLQRRRVVGVMEQLQVLSVYLLY
jgi:hypothetical protein